MKKFSEFVSEAKTTLKDLKKDLKFIKQTDSYSGTFQFSPKTIEQISKTLTKLGYKKEVDDGVFIFRKKGEHPIQINTDSAQTKGLLVIDRTTTER